MQNDQFSPEESNISPATPAETQIAALLQEVDPRPSERFYSMMATSPWMKGDTHMRTSGFRSVPMFLAGALTAMLLIISVTVATPTLRAAAAEWIGFERADRNVVQAPATTVEPLFSANYAEFGDLAVADFISPYKLREPTALPEGYRFVMGRHWPAHDMIELVYRRPSPHNPRMSQTLYVRQWPYDPDARAMVGADARIETVKIGDTQGQYITGAWSFSSVPDAESEQPQRLAWREFTSVPRLRWQDGDVMMEMAPEMAGLFTKDQLVELAESVEITEP